MKQKTHLMKITFKTQNTHTFSLSNVILRMKKSKKMKKNKKKQTTKPRQRWIFTVESVRFFSNSIHKSF